MSSWGKGLKIEANLTTPMATIAVTCCTADEREREHRDTEAEWGTCGSGVRTYPLGVDRQLNTA